MVPLVLSGRLASPNCKSAKSKYIQPVFIGVSLQRIANVYFREYVTITKTYSEKAAEAFARIPASDPTDPSPPPASDPFRFVWVSGEGASTSPGITTQRFGRVKGEVELALAEITDKTAAATNKGSRRIEASSVRPAAVDAHNHTAIIPFVPEPPSVAMGILRDYLGGAIRTLMPGFTSPTPALGTFLAQMAMGKYDAQIKGPNAPKGIESIGSAFKILPNSAFRKLYGLDK